MSTNTSHSVKRIAVTGAAGQISYALLFRLARGDLLGKGQRIVLQLLELPGSMNALRGVVLELEDCALPLLAGVVVTDDPYEAFRGCDYAFLVGSKPRGKGMERRDLLAANAAIFRDQGTALNQVASRDVKVLAVGNPANTNAWIAKQYATDLPHDAISAMIRLDHNRAVAQLASRCDASTDAIGHVAVWGNHSPTMYADYRHATVAGQSIRATLADERWNREVFIPEVARRGTAIIEARGASSAASAANAAIDQMRDWIVGSNGRWVSMSIVSEGEYSIPRGVFCGVPVTCTPGKYHPVLKLDIDSFAREKLNATVRELIDEISAVRAILMLD